MYLISSLPIQLDHDVDTARNQGEFPLVSCGGAAGTAIVGLVFFGCSTPASKIPKFHVTFSTTATWMTEFGIRDSPSV
jgi:hypothetical protein